MRILSLFLVLALLAAGLGSCGERAALEDDGLRLTQAEYRFRLGAMKGNFARTYDDLTDSPETWERDMGDGRTVGAYVEDAALDFAKNLVAAQVLFRDRRLVLPQETQDGIDEYLDEVISYQFDGETSALAASLRADYGMDVGDLRRALLADAQVDYLRETLFSDGVSEEDLADYYMREIVRIRVIYINTAYTYVTDKSGNRVVDPATGYYMTQDLTPEQAAEKERLAREAEERLAAGEPFTDVEAAYSDLALDSAYDDGIFFPRGDASVLLGAGFSASAYRQILDLEENELLTLDGEEAGENMPGRVFILRCPLEEGGYRAKDGSLAPQFTDLPERVEDEQFDAIVREEAENVTVSVEFVRSLHTTDVPAAPSYLTGYSLEE